MITHKIIWSYFPLLFYGVIALGMRYTEGTYDLATLIFLTAGLLGLMLWIVQAKRFNLDGNVSLDRVLAISITVFLLLLLEDNNRLSNIEARETMYIMQCFSILAILISSVAIVRVFTNRQEKDPTLWAMLGGVAICLFAAKVCVPTISPAPFFDIWTTTQQAAYFLLSGVNPYEQEYIDILNGLFGYEAGFHYWPSLLFWVTPFNWATDDFRYGYLACDLITAVAWITIAKSMGLSLKTVLLFILLWWSFPLTYHTLEHGFTESWIIMVVSLLALSLYKEKWLWAAITLGILCAGKQYVIFFAILTFAWLWRYQGLKQAMKLGGITTLTFAIIVAPFAFMHWDSFFDQTIRVFFTIPYRNDALSWAVFINRSFEVGLSSLTTAAIYITVTAMMVLWFWWPHAKRSKNMIFAALFWSFSIIYGVVFLIGKLAFSNYYYLVAFLVLFSFSLQARQEDI